MRLSMKWLFSIFFCISFCMLFAAEPVFYDATPYLEGMAFDNTLPFSRLPLEAENQVRKPVWDLSRNSAGIAAHFITDATEIHVRWELLNDFHMVHMPGTGIRGVDLYVRSDKIWYFVATGKPYNILNTTKLIHNLNGDSREYLLYCPLYDGLKQLSIGINENAVINGVEWDRAPVVFYGTSITQGGCVSRPGMAYPAIIGRKLNVETINLGFSGNGHMDPEIMDYIATIDASCYVFDCFPNMNLDMIRDRAEEVICSMLEKRPDTPLLLVPNIMPEDAWHNLMVYQEITAKNNELEAIYSRLKRKYKNLHYLPAKKIRHVPVEGTVDGIHLTDLGQNRMADVLGKKVKRLIK